MLVALIMLANIVNGFVRHEYHVNFTEKDKPMLVKRKESSMKEYPTDSGNLAQSVVTDYRWLSTIYYTAFAIISTVSVVYLMFEKKAYVQISLALYASVLILIGILLVLSFLTKNYAFGYGIAQYFKNLIQAPLFSFLLIAGFFLFEKKKLG